MSAVGSFFKRVLVSVRERPTSGDLNRLQARLYETIRQLGQGDMGAAANPLTNVNADVRTRSQRPYGFSGISFIVTPNPANTPFGLLVTPGFGLDRESPATATNIDSTNGTDFDEAGWAPFVLSAYEEGLVVPAPPTAGNSRIDIIEVKSSYLATDPQTVGIFNTATEVFDPATRNKSMSWDLLGRTGSVVSPAASTAPISYKKGVEAVGAISAATPPAVTTGYTKIAQINLAGAVASVTQSIIVDFRRPLIPNALLHVAGRATIPGRAAGLGLETFLAQEIPPGVCIKMAYQNNTPPATGTSYTARFYVIGAITPRTNGAFGSLIATPTEFAARCTSVTSTVTTLGTSDIAILDGTDTTWTVVNGTHTFPYGQPAAVLDVTIFHPAGSALTNDEEFCFHYTLCMS